MEPDITKPPTLPTVTAGDTDTLPQPVWLHPSFLAIPDDTNLSEYD